MKGVERVPFRGSATSIGYSNSMDSVVMLLHKDKDISRERVIKWNRRPISSSKEAIDIVKFAKKSIALYEAVLGKRYIIPTEFVVGQKIDGGKSKIKVYEVQPFVDGWDGRTLPDDLRHDKTLLDQWRDLYSRLSVLYIVGAIVNKKIRGQGEIPFYINLALGDCRDIALSKKKVLPTDFTNSIPNTPNLLIDRRNLDLLLCDFGPYTPWNENMQQAYQEIYDKALAAEPALTAEPIESAA